MLARAARRRLRRDAFRSHPQIAEQLTLPWLCPAHLRWKSTIGTIAPAPTRTSRPEPSVPSWASPSLPSRHATRSLATTAEIQPSQHEPIPFNGLVQAWGSRVPNPELSKLQPWDPSRPLVIHESTSSIVPMTNTKFGVGGDPVEMHQNLYACLRVGRMDRAKAILKRLTDLYEPSAPEVVDAHNVFLKSMLELTPQEPSSTAMAEIEAWYETEMIGNTIEPNAQTFVTMLRASMTFQTSDKRENSIRKYMALAQESGPFTLDEVNASPEFSDEQWDALIRFQPDMFEEPPALDEMKDIQLSTPAGYEMAVQHGLIPDPSLAVRSIPQKGLGLSTLKQALSISEHGDNVPYPHEIEGTQEEKDRAHAYLRQIRLEQDATKAAIDRWKAEDQKLQDIGIFGVLQSKPMQALMWHWYSALLPLIQQEMLGTKEVLSNPTKDNMRDERHIYGPWLEQCSAEKLAALTVQRTVASCIQGRRDDVNPLKLATLAITIGRDIESEVNMSTKERHDAFLKKIRNQSRKEFVMKLRKGRTLTPTTNDQAASPTAIPTDSVLKKEFPVAIKTKIGAMAIDLLLRSAMVTVTREDPRTGKRVSSTQRAFQHQTGFSQGKRTGWIAPHHEIYSKLQNERLEGISVMRLPMLVEPKPWVGFESGAYYTTPEVAVRTKPGDNGQKAYAISAIKNGDMEKVLAGMDALGKVPWSINADVFRVMVDAWNAGEGVGGLIPENDGLEQPAELGPDASYTERARWAQQMKEYDNMKGGLHSQRCFQNFQLEIARAYLKDKFYYPHNIDFRGRAYPIPPILNHMGADITRGLLKFGNGKELGAVGLQWLKVHLANLYGYDKASLRDREQFAMDNLAEVYDSASKPLAGNRWWTKAEDPWQCLACCIELRNALESPEPRRFVSNLPIHQDGTCNGLQHYAALGGDEAGANQVNLEPSDRPQDIYTGVADLVKEMVAEDAKAGNSYAQLVDGKITRKVVKRTVMTNVYGVTFMGAKLQVWDELKEIFPNFALQNKTDKIHSLSMVAMYVARKIFKALSQIFNGAQEIQYWLGECGDRITTSVSAEQVNKVQARLNGDETAFDSRYKQPKKVGALLKKKMESSCETLKTSIIWTTPLKMPVVQPYRKFKPVIVRTNLQCITIARQSLSSAVDKRKQLQAFPPNFIHSLDATHMMLSALKCSEMGIDFAAVHDSFWTHAADVPNMNIVLRDAFVRMHSEDIVGRLAAEFKARYAGSMYSASIKTSSPVASKILKWRSEYRAQRRAGKGAHKFDMSLEELAMEKTRQDLLNSEDPEERKKGEEMTTPTSIWLAEQDASSLKSERLSLLGELARNGGKRAKEIEKKALQSETAESIDQETAAMPEEADLESDVVGDAEAEVDVDDEAEIQADAKKTRTRSAVSIKAWLPLTFPPVPSKGTWDVQRLRESKYFFS